MGTPDFAVAALESLIESHNVVGVVTQPDKPAGRGKQMRKSPVKVSAENHNIPVFQPKSLRKPESAQQIVDWQPDVMIVAAYGQILRPHLLDLPKHGCINIHASLLPRWRGASPIQHSILAGDKSSGVCLMHMDVGLDTGAVYSCTELPLTPDETASTLHDKLAQAGADLIQRDLDAILNKEITAVPQDDAASTYASMISKEDGLIDWGDSAETIDRRIRAFSPWPGAFTTYGSKTLKIVSATPSTSPQPLAPGQVTKHENQIMVGTSDGALLLETVQLQGKRAMDVADFSRGRPEFLEATLGIATA